jgi:hypothetical protein
LPNSAICRPLSIGTTTITGIFRALSYAVSVAMLNRPTIDIVIIIVSVSAIVFITVIIITVIAAMLIVVVPLIVLVTALRLSFS